MLKCISHNEKEEREETVKLDREKEETGAGKQGGIGPVEKREGLWYWSGNQQA